MSIAASRVSAIGAIITSNILDSGRLRQSLKRAADDGSPVIVGRDADFNLDGAVHLAMRQQPRYDATHSVSRWECSYCGGMRATADRIDAFLYVGSKSEH